MTLATKTVGEKSPLVVVTKKSAETQYAQPKET